MSRASRGCAALLDERDDAVDDFPHVVRRDVRRHADGDAGRTVDQQVRKGRRQDRRLFGRLVEVGDEVDGLLVEVAHHLFGQRLETRFRVPVGRGRIAVDRAEVALAVDQEIAHVEVLREADERVVGGRVAVRVVVADDFADDLRALAVRPVRREAHLPHRVQHAAVRRLQAVADVRQRSPDDYAHRVIHVRALHLVFDVDGEFVQGDVGHVVIATQAGSRFGDRALDAQARAVSKPERRAYEPRSKCPGSSRRARCLR